MSKASILVVDDEPAVLKVLVTRLQLAGYEVFSATNGEEAIEAFHKESPDLIVLDVMLPKMDGFAVCRRIRAESVVPITKPPLKFNKDVDASHSKYFSLVPSPPCILTSYEHVASPTVIGLLN